MSASIKLTGDQLRRIGAFLQDLTVATRNHGVQVAVHMRGELSVDGGTTLTFKWDEGDSAYIIDEMVGD
jgi:hypothetical protein